jgi:uncharacterized delta-60 repeat protein
MSIVALTCLLIIGLGCRKEITPVPVEVSILIEPTSDMNDSTATIHYQVTTNETSPPPNQLGLILSEDSLDFWNRTPTPIGTGYGKFSWKITGLKKASKYYYAVTSTDAVTGRSRSAMSSLETLYTLPVIQNQQSFATPVTAVSADITYRITDFGGPRVTESGVCYSMNPNPTLNDMKFVADSASIGKTAPTNDIYGILTNLRSNTKYYVRAYARNPAGVAYAEEISFTTTANTTCFVKPLGIVYGGVYDMKLRDGNLYFAGKFKHINGYFNRFLVSRSAFDGTYSDEIRFTRADMPFMGRNIEILNDGKILAAVETKGYAALIKMNPDGAIDPSFSTGGTNTNGLIHRFYVQPDGRIVVAGGFYTFNGNTCNYLTRLKPDGSTDPEFLFEEPTVVYDIHSLADGKTLVLGLRQSTQVIFRLNPNGRIDTTYKCMLDDIQNLFVKQPYISSLRTPDGGLVVSYKDKTSTPVIVRLKPDGSIDTDFAKCSLGNTSYVTTIFQTKDGSYLVGGSFTSINGTTVNSLAKLRKDGTLDQSFNAGSGFDNVPLSIVEGSDGTFTIGGLFTTYRGTPASYITKIKSDGTTCQ